MKACRKRKLPCTSRCNYSKCGHRLTIDASNLNGLGESNMYTAAAG